MNLRQAAEQALEALENHTAIKHPQQRAYRDEAITALRAALAEPTPAEYAMGYAEGFNDACKRKPEPEINFCPRCGKRTNDIHTCTPPLSEFR